MPKLSADVFVTAKGSTGAPTAELLVDPKVTSAQLGALVQRVATNKDILAAAGLRACGGCKSGLDINIRNRFEKIFQVEV